MLTFVNRLGRDRMPVGQSSPSRYSCNVVECGDEHQNHNTIPKDKAEIFLQTIKILNELEIRW